MLLLLLYECTLCIQPLQNPPAARVFIEISGGINPENILSYLMLESDFISTSYVSKNAHSIDLSMLITKIKI
jgi:nicotinate-nucleotide pyrophosphorylase